MSTNLAEIGRFEIKIPGEQKLPDSVDLVEDGEGTATVIAYDELAQTALRKYLLDEDGRYFEELDASLTASAPRAVTMLEALYMGDEDSRANAVPYIIKLLKKQDLPEAEVLKAAKMLEALLDDTSVFVTGEARDVYVGEQARLREIRPDIAGHLNSRLDPLASGDFRFINQPYEFDYDYGPNITPSEHTRAKAVEEFNQRVNLIMSQSGITDIS